VLPSGVFGETLRDGDLLVSCNGRSLSGTSMNGCISVLSAASQEHNIIQLEVLRKSIDEEGPQNIELNQMSHTRGCKSIGEGESQNIELNQMSHTRGCKSIGERESQNNELHQMSYTRGYNTVISKKLNSESSSYNSPHSPHTALNTFKLNTFDADRKTTAEKQIPMEYQKEKGQIKKYHVMLDSREFILRDEPRGGTTVTVPLGHVKQLLDTVYRQTLNQQDSDTADSELSLQPDVHVNKHLASTVLTSGAALTHQVHVVSMYLTSSLLTIVEQHLLTRWVW